MVHGVLIRQGDSWRWLCLRRVVGKEAYGSWRGEMDGADGALRASCVVFWLQVVDRSYLGFALRRVRRL
jgi:hypothetical protein